jgi:hypothetical protein
MARVDVSVSPGTGSTLLVSFSSYGDDERYPKAPSFEWEAALRNEVCHKAYVIDTFRHWYLGPVLGFSHSLHQTVERLTEIAKSLGATRIITQGASMGGFAALNVGGRIGAEVVFAYAPQTNLNLEWLDDIQDDRWPTEMRAVRDIGYEGCDLRATYNAGIRPRLSFIYYDPEIELDRAHAEWLAGGEGVQLMQEFGAGHGVAYKLVKSGTMHRHIRQALASLAPRSGTAG